MLAPAVGIHRPLERHVVADDLVNDRTRRILINPRWNLRLPRLALGLTLARLLIEKLAEHVQLHRFVTVARIDARPTPTRHAAGQRIAIFRGVGHGEHYTNKISRDATRPC